MTHLPRRQFIKTTGLALSASLLPWQRLLAMANGLEDDTQMYLLRDSIGVFIGRGGTIGWLIDDAAMVAVDSQFPDYAKKFIEQAKAKMDREMDMLINTHHHGDHTAGNIAFKGLVKKVVAHENSKANQMRVAIERNQEEGQLYPDQTFTHQWSERVGKEIITAKYFGPAHTNGDAIIHFENANVAHMGDLMFNRRFPFIDRSAGASISNWIKVLKTARKTYDKDTLFIFGHAAEGRDITGTHADLKAFENYLKRLLQFTKKQIKTGKNLEELKAAGITSIPKAEEWTGDGIERSLQAAYEELTAK